MSNSTVTEGPADSALADGGRDSAALRNILTELSESIKAKLGVVVTSLPRGGLQLIQPARVPDSFAKLYSRRFHAHDCVAWQAIARGKAVLAKDCWPEGDFEKSAYFSGFLQATGLRFVAAAPVIAPVLDGYDGAIELFRTAEQGAFGENELAALQVAAEQLSRAMQESGGPRTESASVAPRLPRTRQFIFDSHLRISIGESEFNTLDAGLRTHLLDLVRQRLGQVNGKPTVTDRVSVADSRGDLWNFRVVTHREYPALGNGPHVFLCLQPECSDWATLDESDFAADPEIARLVPALKFMREQFQRGPTLQEIARTVHLSPFHFHRRFTELLGITPKHVLLDCQIGAAKAHLISRDKELSEIASACGFAHQSHFTSRFKQATGLTPTRWRRMSGSVQQ